MKRQELDMTPALDMKIQKFYDGNGTIKERTRLRKACLKEGIRVTFWKYSAYKLHFKEAYGIHK